MLICVLKRNDTMNTVQRIAKNTGVLAISQVINSILGFFLLIYIARYLGEVGFGKYSFALAFTGLFTDGRFQSSWRDRKTDW